jgi:hypothetical protein
MAKPKHIKAEDWENLPQIVHDRVYLQDRTLGSWIASNGGILCKVLELPWKDNARSVSCIPEDEYLVTYSDPVLQDDPNTEVDESGGRIPRPYAHYIIHNVPNRSGILAHAGTDVTHSLGCQIVGSRFVDYNTDQPKLSDSRVKLKWLTENLPRKFRLLVEAKSGTPYK